VIVPPPDLRRDGLGRSPAGGLASPSTGTGIGRPRDAQALDLTEAGDRFLRGLQACVSSARLRASV
jgi:hypothetical protein